MTAQTGPNIGPELLVGLDRGGRLSLRAQLEEVLREAVRSGRLPAGMRLPASRMPDARVTGLAAGLHAIVRLAVPVDGLELAAAAWRQSVGVYPLGLAYIDVQPVHDGLILGYANLAEPAIEEGIRRLARALEESSGPRPANDGGAIAR